jgi:hypothetical protein
MSSGPSPSGPAKTLEAIVGLFVPPACREEVLGDLYEKYTGSGQYVVLALQVVPCVIVSRFRRTTDVAVLLMEALLVYGSYLAAAWYTGQWGLTRLAVPAVLAVWFMLLEDAWSVVTSKSPLRLTGEVVVGTFFTFLCMIGTLPETLNLLGASASLLLVSAIRILFRPQFGGQQTAAGPAMPREPAVISRDTKSIYAVSAASVLVAISLAWPKSAPIFVFVYLVILVGFSRASKE